MNPARALVFVVLGAAAIAGLCVALLFPSGNPVVNDSGSIVADNDVGGGEAGEAADDTRAEIGFRAAEAYDTGGEPFADEVVTEIVTTLDELLARPETAEDFERQAGLHLWRYTTRLANGYLTPEQQSQVVAQLDRWAAARPDDAELFENARFMVENLMLGRLAPNIVGKDLDGVEFELAEYRGKVVAIVFTGQWCGPCRSEYPYQRLLLEVMDEEDFVLLGVNSDADVEVAKQAKIDERLDYRAWWDGHAEEATHGPIATTWNVSGWPTIYVLDESGVIRRRGPRQENLITAAKDLVSEMKRRRADQ